MSATAILLVHGSLRERMAAELTGFVYGSGGVIVGHDQYVDRERSRYFARLEWSLDGARIDRRALTDQVRDITRRLELTAGLYFSADVPRIALFVSNLSHCLYDILGRWRSGEWRVEIPIVVSNHESLGDVARRFDVEFRHVPVSADIKNTQEHAQIELPAGLGKAADPLKQLVGPELIEAYPNRIINIHHAFLPAFPGARPYHRAHRRGVKIIGATSHYVTEELDAGPIIEQDVIRVSHATSVDDMLRLGRDLERTVLARAVWLHLQRRVLVDEGRTVIFA